MEDDEFRGVFDYEVDQWALAVMIEMEVFIQALDELEVWNELLGQKTEYESPQSPSSQPQNPGGRPILTKATADTTLIARGRRRSAGLTTRPTTSWVRCYDPGWTRRSAPCPHSPPNLT